MFWHREGKVYDLQNNILFLHQQPMIILEYDALPNFFICQCMIKYMMIKAT